MSTEQALQWLDDIEPLVEETEADLPDGPLQYQPHDGQDSDLNLHYADMAAGPDPQHATPLLRPRGRA